MNHCNYIYKHAEILLNQRPWLTTESAVFDFGMIRSSGMVRERCFESERLLVLLSKYTVLHLLFKSSGMHCSSSSVFQYPSKGSLNVQRCSVYPCFFLVCVLDALKYHTCGSKTAEYTCPVMLMWPLFIHLKQFGSG